MDDFDQGEAETFVVDEIDSRDALEDIREAYDWVYAADPEARFFLSSAWLWPWLRSMEPRWVLLGVRQASSPRSYVAFMPLQQRTHMHPKGGFYNELAMAGSRLADYTGLLCLPQCDKAVIPLIGDHIRKMSWRRLAFEQVRMSDERMSLLFGGFGAATAIDRAYPPAQKGVDNSICPFAELPSSFDTYLLGLSANSRQKIRRVLRKAEGDPAFRFTVSTHETLERDVGLLLGLWDKKWRPQKGERTDVIMANMRFMLIAAGRAGTLYLPMLWRDGNLLGALGNLIDPVKKEMLFLIAGRSSDADDVPPGIALHAYAIRSAIERGLRIYDFLRGDEKYKFSFARETHRIPDLTIDNPGGFNHDGGLDRRGFRKVLAEADKLAREGKPALAEAGYRQLIGADPDNAHALAAYAHLRLASGDAATAEPLLVRALSKDRGIASAWRDYAKLRAAQGRAVDAVASYQQALKLDRKSAEAWNGLARALGRLGRAEDQIKAYDNALKLKPDDRGIELNRANALFWLHRLPETDHARYSQLNAQFGRAHHAKGDLKRAASFFRLALLLNQEDVGARLALAGILERTGKMHEAEAHYRSVLARRPRNRVALQRLVAAGASKARVPSPKSARARAKGKRARNGTRVAQPAF